MENQPGEQFGRYELVSQLGRGGMAETWRARLLGAAGVTKPVLIKKILPEYSNDKAFTEMFVSEARISATLSHGNVAQVFDFGEVDGEYFLAMEFVDGQPLNRLMKRAQKTGLPHLPVALATFIAIEMCRGLHYAHTRTDDAGEPLDIVHRDISPDNVLLSYEGQVKIVDFGIAKARALRSFKTEAGVVKGKYLFFSPEQARGEEVDARTDVWATAVVLYDMLCGRLPLEGPPHVVIQKLVNGDFPRPRALRPELPAELDEIVMRALTVERDGRTESCHEFGNALAGFLFATAPRFSSLSLAHLVKELFRQDLVNDGRDVRIPASFLEEIAMWREAARTTKVKGSTAAQKMTSARDVVMLDGSSGDVNSEEATQFRRKVLLALAGVGALGLGVAAVATIPSEEPEPIVAEASRAPPPVESQPTPIPRPAAPSAEEQTQATTKPPSTEQATAKPPPAPEEPSGRGTATYPVDAFTLDASRDVVRPSDTAASSTALDPRVTYRLFEESPPSDSPPLFYLLSGEPPLTPDSSVGMVTERPVTLIGVKKITVFGLGASGPSRIRYVQVEDARSSRSRPIEVPTIRVNSQMSVASLERAFTLKGLSSASTYELKLPAKQPGARLQGERGGVVRKAVCVRQPDPAADTESLGSPDKDEQFLLQPGKAVVVKAARALSCGVIDSDPSDNHGSLEIAISERGRR
ncbi:protein kinase [Myxococcaceae bacterium GXIMD 01537]